MFLIVSHLASSTIDRFEVVQSVGIRTYESRVHGILQGRESVKLCTYIDIFYSILYERYRLAN